MTKAKLLQNGFVLSKQERSKLLSMMDRALDGPEDHTQIADVLTASVLDIKEQREF